MNKKTMALWNGFVLSAEQNQDTDYSFELFLDIEKDGVQWQQIALIGGVPEESSKKHWPADGLYRVMVPPIGRRSPGDDLEEVENQDTNKPVFPRRERAEHGMIPRSMMPSGSDLDARIFGTEDFLCAIFVEDNDSEKEVYVGIKRNCAWWQNLLRVRFRKRPDGAIAIRWDVFSERDRSYVAARETSHILDRKEFD